MRLKRASCCVERGSTCPLAVAVPPGAKSNANVKISPVNAPPAPWLGCGLTPVVTNAWVITRDDCLLSRGVCGMAKSPTLEGMFGGSRDASYMGVPESNWLRLISISDQHAVRFARRGPLDTSTVAVFRCPRRLVCAVHRSGTHDVRTAHAALIDHGRLAPPLHPRCDRDHENGISFTIPDRHI